MKKKQIFLKLVLWIAEQTWPKMQWIKRPGPKSSQIYLNTEKVRDSCVKNDKFIYLGQKWVIRLVSIYSQ